MCASLRCPRLSAVALVLAVPLVATRASAQIDSTRADSLRRPTGLGTVVVTAQRRAESAQRTGVALSALTGTQLAERGVVSPFDLQRVVPSLEIEPAFGGGQPQYRLRGIGFNDYASNNSSTVGVYQDQVALPFPVQTQGLLFDVARVEVLRGPQGTLYGRNSTGGAINVVSQSPVNRREGSLQVGGGSFGAFDAEAMGNLPITSTVLARLAVATQQGGGWQRNRLTRESLGDRDQRALRAQVAWTPTLASRVKLIGSVEQDRGDAQGLLLFRDLATRGGAGATIPADVSSRNTGWALRPAFANILGVDASRKPGRDNRAGGLTVEASHTRRAFAVPSVTAWQTFRRREIGDWDASASAESDEAFYDDIRVFSQELRIASRDSARFEWLGGVYAAREALDARFYSDFADVPGLGAAARTQYGQRASVAALFGQVGLPLSAVWRLVGGVRMEYEHRQLDGLTTGFIAPAVTFVPPTNRSLLTRLPSAKLAFEYRPSSRTLAWVGVNRGIKSGGFTAYNTTNVAQLAAFAPERVDALEVGAKLQPTRSLRVNAATYLYDYRDQQVLSTVYDNVSRGPIGRIANAKRSRVLGMETEVVWEPARGVEIAPFAAVTGGTFREFFTTDAQASVAAGREVQRDFSGKRLPIPRVSLGGAATITRVLRSQLWRAQLSASYRDTQQASRVIFSPQYDLPSYTLVNATLTWQRASSPFTVELWARNLTGRQYDITRNFFLNAQVAAAGAPRTVGVRIRVSDTSR
ncbi:TonB-dependent receptor [Gemmatimonas sp.]|uniref:TonB-dependent receptor n=1 Tax=Gemmatimonas sp. TaxID=1962908 RepID=UPI003F71FDE1